ncbi:ROK family glucokinase [Aeromicrobium sp. 636]|uniref:Glucokinase n=1 Tax=Aeromicrobium senzhongii TaxID=2663859 RepID=A0A8I0EU77_9ACTN|nr:ROK family glucokinase [Aeromicrobium sp. 636]MBC9225463.1 ROK family glucokinase [Aeromicrobium senzhongii]MCQ3997573.1 ROK family glucokinase [Aeromicrobium sp. 636]
MSERLAVGIDVGGTKIAGGVVDEDGRVVARARRATPTTDPTAVLDAITEIVAEFRAQYVVRAVGVGAAGYVDVTGSTVVFSPHLAWRNEPLRDALVRRTALPVLVDNDANAAGWAEWRFGAAQNHPDVVMVNLGTGIGGAMVLDGRLYRGHSGMAGEFGHQRVVEDGRPCPCGNRGCWEQYASGRVLQRRASAAVAEGSDIGRALVDLAGTPEQVDGTIVGRLAMAGDEEAIAWVGDVGRWLGIGLANLAAALDPGIFVIGGGVSENGEALLRPARHAFADHLTGRGYRSEARIVAAHLGNDAGLVGAADLARLRARRRRLASPGYSVRGPAVARSDRRRRRRSR